MQIKSLVAVLAVVSTVVASPLHWPRQSGAPHTPSGKAPGTQFITGNCASDADCESTCCDPVKGLCAAFDVAQEDGDGCTGDSGATAPVASSAAAVVAATTATASAAASTGTQFITGTCGSDSDCASGCCDAVTGLCAATLVAEQDGHGCGFDGTPQASSAAATVAGTSSAAVSTFASSGKAAGTQFITGNCAATSECASNCCDAKTGLCAALLVAQQNGHGCLAQ